MTIEPNDTTVTIASTACESKYEHRYELGAGLYHVTYYVGNVTIEEFLHCTAPDTVIYRLPAGALVDVKKVQ